MIMMIIYDYNAFLFEHNYVYDMYFTVYYSWLLSRNKIDTSKVSVSNYKVVFEQMKKSSWKIVDWYHLSHIVQILVHERHKVSSLHLRRIVRHHIISCKDFIVNIIRILFFHEVVDTNFLLHSYHHNSHRSCNSFQYNYTFLCMGMGTYILHTYVYMICWIYSYAHNY